MSQVRCYNLYNVGKDEYNGCHYLCDECVGQMVITDDNISLHDSGPTNRPCEICEEYAE